ncbi:MAG: N-acetylmuramoyl-L-alanine amidase [Selenomonadaceae bacterium]|nr:N-acetylmuramoyl-L-alanine amidase [Selenomonadaceae bacterium]
MRVGQFNANTVRIVIETIAEIKTFVLEGGPSGCRLVIDVITPKPSTPKQTTPSTVYEPPSHKEDEKAKVERERKAKEERERKAHEERERQLQEEKERKAREERERKLQERERQLQEKERQLQEEKERLLKEERERKAKEEKENKHKENKHEKVEPPAPANEIDKDLASLMTLKGKVIAIDPGHGGNDAGAIGPSGVMEKTVTLNVALELEKMLKAEGATVIMTRHTDKTVSPNGAKASAIEELQARCDVANRAKADIFISIHADSFTNPSARGTTGYYYSQTEGQASIKLADCIRKALCEQIRTPSRGTKPCNFYVVRNTDMAATLIELAFISNPDEENILSSPEGILKCAQGIFDGIEDYFG